MHYGPSYMLGFCLFSLYMQTEGTLECVEQVPASANSQNVCNTGSVQTQLLFNGTYCGEEFIEVFKRNTSGLYNNAEYYTEVPPYRYEGYGPMYIFRKKVENDDVLWTMSTTLGGNGGAYTYGQQCRHDFRTRLDHWSQWCSIHSTISNTTEWLNLRWPISIKEICVPCESGKFSVLAQTLAEIDHCQPCPPSYSAAALSTAFANQIPTVDCMQIL